LAPRKPEIRPLEAEGRGPRDVPSSHVHKWAETTQVAPTILQLLGLDPNALQAVRIEGTRVLPGIGR
jgi:hypothetical protein